MTSLAGPRPLIAVPGRSLRAGKAGRNPTVVAGRLYLEALHRAGAWEMVVACPTQETPDDERTDWATALVERTDGVLLLGGPDVDPALYGADPHAQTYGLVRNDDDAEIALVHAALSAQKPLLAICRGIQVLNVALGGTLHQHLDDDPALLAHHPDTWPKANPGEHGPLLDIAVDAGSRIADACGAVTIVGAHSHHQAVDALGTGLRVTGRTADGVVGVLEHDDGWAVGVQWHPEDTAATDPQQQRLFARFVAEAARRADDTTATPVRAGGTRTRR